MKKKSLLVLLIAAVTLVVVGCGSSKKTTESKKETDEGKKFGWYSVVVPDGYSIDEYGTEFTKNEEGSSLSYKIVVTLYDSGYGTAEENFNEEIDDGFLTDAGEEKIGNYTWKKGTFSWDNDLESVKYYAQIDDEYYVEIDSFDLGLDDKEVLSFIKSFKILDGDCEENQQKFYTELNEKN